MIQGNRQALQNVCSGFRLCQIELRPAGNDLFLMLHIIMQDFLEIQDSRPAIHQGQHDSTEAVLHLRVLVELIQDDIGIGITAQINDNPHAIAIRFIPEIRDTFNRLITYQISDFLDQLGLVDLIRDLRHNDARLAVGKDLDMGIGPHRHDAAACHIRLAYTVGSHDETARWEIRSLDDCHELLDRRIRVVDEHEHAINDLAHIMRRDIRRHADRDTRGTIDQQLRELRRQHDWFLQGLIVVRHEVNGFLFDILQHELSYLGHPDFRITHSRRWIAIDGTKVAVAIRQHVANGKILGHAHDCIIYRAVAMRMIFTKNFTDDTR